LSYLQYDEDIESIMTGHREKEMEDEDLHRFTNLLPAGARVDDQGGHSFGTLFL
jgi:hypothetical protein